MPATGLAGCRGPLPRSGAESRKPSVLHPAPARSHQLLRGATGPLHRSRGSTDLRELRLRCATTITYQTVLRTRFAAEVTACQRDSSVASCFLPAAVSS